MLKKGNDMLRELKTDEMEVVSGGHFHENPVPSVFAPERPSTLDLLGPNAGWVQGGTSSTGTPNAGVDEVVGNTPIF